MRLRPVLAGAAVVAALGWLALRSPAPAGGGDPHLLRQDLLALGTLVSVSVYLDDPDHAPRAREALADSLRDLQAFEREWSPWGEGRLGDLNRALAAGGAATIEDDHTGLFARAEDVRRASGGAFDARLGALVRLWGFDDEAHFRTEPPPGDEIDALTAKLRAAPAFSGPGRYGPAPAVQWDFGGIAKGTAVERLVARLKTAGFGNVIVNAGGNLRAAGRHGERRWRIGIRNPRARSPTEVLASFQSEGDEAVVTSGDYERFFEAGGIRYHHILDPRTGRPARGLQAVTVVHPDAELADAAATALFVAGPDRWRRVARDLGVERAMVVLDSGQVQVTQALSPRLQFAGGVTATAVP